MTRCLYCGIFTNNPKFCSIKCKGKFYSGDKNIAKRPEIRKLHKDKNPMKIPEIKEKHKNIMKEINNKSEVNKKRSQSLKQYWSKNEERRKNISKKMMEDNPNNKVEVREKHREIALRQWANLEYREKYKRKINICHNCGKETYNKNFCSNKCANIINNASGNRHRGKHHTEKTKQILSQNHKGKMKGKDNPMYGKSPYKGSGRGKGCYYESPLQGKIWLRSSYELAYVKYLDSQKILWYYEIQTFDLGDTTYTPDFFLPQFEKFIEIKGYMLEKYQEKINKFLEQYPFDLDILYKEDLIKLGVKL